MQHEEDSDDYKSCLDDYAVTFGRNDRQDRVVPRLGPDRGTKSD